jgi:hypothetical protein
VPGILVALAAIAGSRLAGWFPCDVVCDGAGRYQVVLGIPTTWLLLGCLLPLAVLTWLGCRRRWWVGGAISAGAWLMAGGAAYFLWLSWRIGLFCPFCLAVHGGVFALAAAAAWPERWRPPLPVALMVAGFCLMLAAYALDDRLFPDEPPVPMAIASTATVARIERGRREGRADAPAVLEMFIDAHCRRCAEHAGPLADALRPLIAAGQVQVVNRFLVRERDPTGRELAVACLAAGASGRFGLVWGVALGTPEGAGLERIRPRLAEVIDLAALESAGAVHAGAIAAILAGDGRRAAELRFRRTPSALLTRDGREVGRWHGEWQPAAIAAGVKSEVGSRQSERPGP